MKKRYMKPSMKVFDIQPTRIICTSSNDWPVGYAPGINADENQLA